VLEQLMTLAVAAAATASAAAPPPVCIAPDGARIRLELAISREERGLGLMFRDTLPADSGMLFLFTEDDRHPFWMKDTFIPLDLVWLDPAGKVVDVKAGVQPCRRDPCPSYTPAGKGRAVLEVNAGFAAAHGIAAGAQVRCENVPEYPVKGPVK
jgi:uncharacterized protein